MKFKEKFTKLIPTKRKLIQLYSALLFNANFKGFVNGSIYQGNTKRVCIPSLNCYSCPGAVGACPLGSLQGSFSAGKSTVYYVFGILFLLGFILGRTVCGFLCPYGLIQELLHKIKTPKLKKSRVTKLLSAFKYVILVFFVFIVPILYALRDTPLPAFCKYICPAGTLEGGIGLLSNKVNESYFSMLGPLFTWKFILLISFTVGSIFVYRLFCRFICPLGAFYGFFNKISVFGVRVDDSKCTDCNLCVNRCKLDISRVGDNECIFCGECIDVCPTKAIDWRGPKILLRENSIGSTENVGDGKKLLTKEELLKRNEKIRRRNKTVKSALAVIMIVFLIGVVIYYWNQPEPITADVGNEVGDLCYSYDLQRIYTDGISEETFDPTATGKITVINFWGTWCTPCVNELPYFAQIAADYSETVTVVAIHTNMVNATAPEFISKYYPDTELIFATDYSDNGIESYYTSLGGRGTYPYTVIIDKNGIITNIFVDALEYDDLKNAIDAIE